MNGSSSVGRYTAESPDITEANAVIALTLVLYRAPLRRKGRIGKRKSRGNGVRVSVIWLRCIDPGEVWRIILTNRRRSGVQPKFQRLQTRTRLISAFASSTEARRSI